MARLEGGRRPHMITIVNNMPGLIRPASTCGMGWARPVRTFGAALLSLGLLGCVPWRYSYEHLDVPGARYFQSACQHSAGPPSMAYYPFHVIFISLDVTHTVTLGLHLPAGTTAALNGTTVRITGSADSGPVDAIMPIRAARHLGLNGSTKHWSQEYMLVSSSSGSVWA
jgi:hypothetical protein